MVDRMPKTCGLAQCDYCAYASYAVGMLPILQCIEILTLDKIDTYFPITTVFPIMRYKLVIAEEPQRGVNLLKVPCLSAGVAPRSQVPALHYASGYLHDLQVISFRNFSAYPSEFLELRHYV